MLRSEPLTHGLVLPALLLIFSATASFGRELDFTSLRQQIENNQGDHPDIPFATLEVYQSLRFNSLVSLTDDSICFAPSRAIVHKRMLAP